MDDHAFDFTIYIRNDENHSGESALSGNSLVTYAGEDGDNTPTLSFRCSGQLVVVALSDVLRISLPASAADAP